MNLNLLLLILLIDGTQCGDAACTLRHESFEIGYYEKADSNKQNNYNVFSVSSTSLLLCDYG